VLARGLTRLDNTTLQEFPEFQEFRRRSSTSPASTASGALAPIVVSADCSTPEERIEAAYHEIVAELGAQLLERIRCAKPEFFEALIVDLMIAMGYGGSRPEAGQRLGKSGDGGVDGLISEDILGLDSIYLQAKRHAPGNVIGVEKVREFAGALVERGASKGVFVTTSDFASGAKAYAERIPQKLILINGDELTRLMVRYNVGIRVSRHIELKKIDLDYFDEDEQS
jgi:restriction system protein